MSHHASICGQYHLMMTMPCLVGFGFVWKLTLTLQKSKPVSTNRYVNHCAKEWTLTLAFWTFTYAYVSKFRRIEIFLVDVNNPKHCAESKRQNLMLFTL